MIFVKLAAAIICISHQCYPALVGNATPVGTFQVQLVRTQYPGYGGDILMFAQTPKEVLAIHRIFLLNPKQHRQERIESSNPKERVITNGCINVLPEVYERLKQCCSNDKLEIVR